MAYINTDHLFKCETCRRYKGDKCLAWCENGECYSPNMKKISTADVVPKSEVARGIFAEIEELAKIYTFPVVKNGVVEIAKEPFWCIEPSDLAILKKKYIGEQK